MILHIPHASTKMINGVKVSNLEDNLNLLTDWYTDEIFDGPNKIVFPYSRLSIDVERLKDKEPMEKFGMGIFYTKDAFQNDIMRRVSSNTLMKFYEKHHKMLVDEIEKQNNCCLIIDCHSFPGNPFIWEHDQNKRPDICLGVNSYHTPDYLQFFIVDYFEKHGLSVKINDPYCGTIVPKKFYKKNKSVKSIMIEINRKLYLDNKYNKNNNFDKIKQIIQGLLMNEYIRQN